MKHLISNFFFALLLCHGALLASSAHAAIAGKPVIFVHGLQTTHLFTPRGQVTAERLRADAISQAGVVQPFIDDYIWFPSHERLRGGIAMSVYWQIKQMEEKGTCSNGCFLVTASTGDLVMRYVLSRLSAWRIDSKKFRILASLDAVGAGGGTELADLIVNAITADNQVSSFARQVLTLWLGGEFEGQSPSGLGVGNDLRPTMARAAGITNTAIPHLRLAGGGQILPFFDFTGPFILGGDDGVVPLHSACGARYKQAIYSCTNDIAIDGREGWALGPRWGYYHNHFPVFMAKNMSHTQLGTSDPVGTIVAVSKNVNTAFGGVKFAVKEQTRTSRWWWWTKTHRTVKYDESKSMAQFLFDSLTQ